MTMLSFQRLTEDYPNVVRAVHECRIPPMKLELAACHEGRNLLPFDSGTCLEPSSARSKGQGQ